MTTMTSLRQWAVNEVQQQQKEAAAEAGTIAAQNEHIAIQAAEIRDLRQ